MGRGGGAAAVAVVAIATGRVGRRHREGWPAPRGCASKIRSPHPVAIPPAGVELRENLVRQTACKPGSVHALAGNRWPFVWDARCRTPRATYPGGGAETRLAVVRRPGRAAPIRSCSRWGLPCRPRRRGRGALLPHPFTLACRAEAGPAVCFLWHFPWGRPRRPLTGTVLPWSPDFPPPAGFPRRGRRPSGRLARAIYRDSGQKVQSKRQQGQSSLKRERYWSQISFSNSRA